MELKGKTLAKVLRMRSTLARDLAEVRNRALKHAVVEKDLKKPDFNTSACLEDFIGLQSDLRVVKTATATKSVSTFVKIPEDIPVAEAGSEVPLIQAILIRDDLKATASLLKQLTEFDASDFRDGYGEHVRLVERERTFDFEVVLTLLDEVQEAIDNIDDIIQGTDATTRFS
jgi:hypothetical protein